MISLLLHINDDACNCKSKIDVAITKSGFGEFHKPLSVFFNDVKWKKQQQNMKGMLVLENSRGMPLNLLFFISEFHCIKNFKSSTWFKPFTQLQQSKDL